MDLKYMMYMQKRDRFLKRNPVPSERDRGWRSASHRSECPFQPLLNPNPWQYQRRGEAAASLLWLTASHTWTPSFKTSGKCLPARCQSLNFMRFEELRNMWMLSPHNYKCEERWRNTGINIPRAPHEAWQVSLLWWVPNSRLESHRGLTRPLDPWIPFINMVHHRWYFTASVTYEN